MANIQTEYKHDARVLARELYDIAKGWLAVSLLCKLLAFMVGAVAIFLSAFSQQAPFFVAILSAAAELLVLRSDTYRGIAEAVRRKVDLQESFGWNISRAEMSDLLVKTPSKIRKRIETQTSSEPYFDSKEATGPRRALENTRESAWWSKHLAERIGQIYLIVMITLVAISLVVLIISIQTIQNFDVLSNIGRIVTATVMLIFSLSLIRMTIGYYKFSQISARIEEQAEQLLNNGSNDSVQAVKVMNEYHLARATAPMIPTWVWKWMRNDLYELWKSYRSSP